MQQTEPTYEIRLADLGDVAALPGIERAASQRFVEVGYPELAEGQVTDLSTLIAAQREERLWVAVARHEQRQPTRRAWAAGDEPEEVPVGFVLVQLLDGMPHIQEMDVLPNHGRRGLGRGMVRRVIDQSKAQGHDKLTLTTFKNVPWNAPFYNSLGFREIPAARCGDELKALFNAEAEAGLPVDDRVVMVHDLVP